MKLRPTTMPATKGVDWKAVGYLTSIASVFFLGAVASLKDNPPSWYFPALLAGIATSILGMGFRYKAHRDEQREIRKAQEEAENQPVRPRRDGEAPRL
jgi:hypothetical protein